MFSSWLVVLLAMPVTLSRVTCCCQLITMVFLAFLPAPFRSSALDLPRFYPLLDVTSTHCCLRPMTFELGFFWVARFFLA